jgi:hypothetical protein
MWIHHLQLLSVLVFGIVLLVFLLRQISSNKNASGKLNYFLAPISVLCVAICIPLSGWTIPIKPETPPGQWLSPRWTQPPEVAFLKSDRFEELKESKTYARLGHNDDLGIVAFLPRQWRMVCRDYAQYGHETSQMINRITECLESKPEFILISPGFFPCHAQLALMKF